MGHLPSIRRIVKEDIPNAPDWINALIDPLNTFMEEVYRALDNDLSLNENVIGAIKTLNFTTRSDYGSASPLTDGWVIQKLQDPIGIKPSVVAIGNVVKSDFSVTTDTVSTSWDYINGELRIKYIAGLEASTTYKITLLIF